ncbi:MAG: glycosyltransferase family 2 protein [Helicobacter sp.]|nr:glycosyltransferase family 2 protein [Helicobacteraceae bacterium]MDY3114288.1 glycosyltransferase family 2 protein [Helicobacter sp.]
MQNQSKKVGIVIPIYNVEKYLKDCLESVINQTYKNLKIVLVDDGSTDSSLKLAKEYALKDNRITIITKENGGLSSARNAGISYFMDGGLAKGKESSTASLRGSGATEAIHNNGRQINAVDCHEFSYENSRNDGVENMRKSFNDKTESQKADSALCTPLSANRIESQIDYIYFLDSDDWVDVRLIESFVAKMQSTNSDLCLGGCVSYYEERNELFQWDGFSVESYGYKGLETATWQNIKKSIIYKYAAWLKFYNFNFLKTLLDENGHFYKNGVLFEDVVPHFRSIFLSKKICFLDENLYFYRIRESSIMGKSANSARIFDVFLFVSGVESFLKEHGFFSEYENEFYEFIYDTFIYHYGRCGASLRGEFLKKAFAYADTLGGLVSKKLSNLIKAQTIDPQGAVKKIKSQLSYKLGSAMVESKSPLRILTLPFKLISIIKKHNFEKKVNAALYKLKPELAPLAIECYSDYKEALEIKKHLSYRLGNALVKNPLLFVFRIPKIYRDYKKGVKVRIP